VEEQSRLIGKEGEIKQIYEEEVERDEIQEVFPGLLTAL
jgi:hypothetical protein